MTNIEIDLDENLSKNQKMAFDYYILKKLSEILEVDSETIIDLTSINHKNQIKKSLEKKYYSKAKPYYRMFMEELHKELKSVEWSKERLLIDIKADGLRLTSGKVNGEGYFYVDPSDLKEKSPDVTDRLPKLKRDIEDILPDNTVLDSEFIAVDPESGESLHRTTANSILNSNLKGKKLEEYAYVLVFDVLYWKGEDVTSRPLKERLELLQQIDSTDNIIIEDTSTNIEDKADAYIVDGSNKSNINKAIYKILNDKIGRPKHIAEGVMIKKLDHPYETIQNHGWAKVKELYELDLRVLEKDSVKGSRDVYNYTLGIDIDKEYFNKIVEMDTKDWYYEVGVLDGNDFYRGKEAKDKNGQYVMIMGKTDNHAEESDIEIGEIIRIAAEEVLEYDNPDNKEYPRYSFYVGIVIEENVDKSVSDKLSVADKLAGFQPKRIPVEELERINNTFSKAYDIGKYVEEGKIPKDVYKKVAEENKPLPEEFYVDYREGKAWSQFHIRGIDKEKYDKYQNDEINLEELVTGESLHCDLRMQFEDYFIQWVVTQDDIEDYIATLKGDNDPDTGNVSKGLGIVKPSSEEPKKEPTKSKNLNDKSEDEKLISEGEDAKIVAETIDMESSYFIEPGEVGATKNTYSLMGTIWQGKARSGVQRDDTHEYFLEPFGDNELWNGRYIVKCFDIDSGNKWWVWKAKVDPKPMDPIEHSDCGDYWPVPASEIDKFGHDAYRDESKDKYSD